MSELKKLSVQFLKVSIVLILIPVIVLGLYGLIWLPGNPVSPRYAHMIYPVLVGFYLASVPVLYAGSRLYVLLTHVSKDTLTPAVKVKILSKLKKAAAAAGAVFLLIMPFFFLIADEDDAPGLIIVSGIPVLFTMIAFAVITLFEYSASREKN